MVLTEKAQHTAKEQGPQTKGRATHTAISTVYIKRNVKREYIKKKRKYIPVDKGHIWKGVPRGVILVSALERRK